MNILESQKYYSSLSILEVSLKNAIDFYFVDRYGDDWIYSTDVLKDKDLLSIEADINEILGFLDTQVLAFSTGLNI